MNTKARYLLLSLALLLSLHLLLAFTHEGYERATSLSGLGQKLRPTGSEVKHSIDQSSLDELATTKRANASFVILCRNSDLEGIVRSIAQMEARFNYQYRYPYVFLNNEPFTDEFKRSARSSFSI